MSSEDKDAAQVIKNPAAVVKDSAQTMWDNLEESLEILRFVIQTYGMKMCNQNYTHYQIFFVQNLYDGKTTECFHVMLSHGTGLWLPSWCNPNFVLCSNIATARASVGLLIMWESAFAIVAVC